MHYFFPFVEEYDRKASYHELIERLRRSNCRDILTNKNLLSDNDVVQLLRSYVNDSMLMNIKNSNVQTLPHQNISKIFQTQPVVIVSPSTNSKRRDAIKAEEEQLDNSETMEVSVDPGMYLDEESIVIEDDEETVSAAETKIETAKLKTLQAEAEIESESGEKTLNFADTQSDLNTTQNDGQLDCIPSLENISSNTEVESQTSCPSTKISESAITKPSKKKKLRSRRKKIIIRINPSPSKRNVRERAKILPVKTCKFSCSICKKSLSR